MTLENPGLMEIQETKPKSHGSSRGFNVHSIYIIIYLIKIPLKWLCTQNVSHYNLAKKNSMGKNLSKGKKSTTLLCDLWILHNSIEGFI